MASAYAEKAVQKAREFNVHLDYSEDSLLEVEAVLSQLRDNLSGAGEADDLAEICKTWGSYFGEVVRRRFGGEWSIETYPGKQFATLTLSVGANKLFPTMKVHRRLTHGAADNVWLFYEAVKIKLDVLPGARIQ